MFKPKKLVLRGTFFFFIKVPVLSQEGARTCTCMLGVSSLPLSTLFLLDFGIVPTG